MRWVPKPTDCYSDLGLDEAGEAAEILWHRAWAWCGHQETGGFIPTAMVARLCPTRTRARVQALLKVGKWVEVDGGYQVADFDDAMGELKSLIHRRKSDAERARRYRAKHDASEAASRPPSADASRPASRDDHALEEKRDNPPNPPASRGANCDPLSPTHDNCRGCCTTPRARAKLAEAAEQQRQADELAQLQDRRAAVAWCGNYLCDRRTRRRIDDDGGTEPCPACHPDVVVGPLPGPVLTVVGAR